MRERRGTYLQTEVRLPPGFVLPSAALVPSRPPSFCEATDCGCTSELHCGLGLLPRRPPGQVEFRPLILTARRELTEADAAEIRARWRARHAGQPPVALDGSGELAERIAAPLPPVVAACSGCRTVTDLEAGRCAYCAELDALRWKRRPWAAGRMAVAAVVAVVLVAVLFVGVLIGLGMRGL